ncbi:MAG TPA: hypothetical protein PKH89_01930 [Anaerolineae bacterium]|nr:hypothetical protein [Anaerolineae bacterium]
MEEMTLTDMVVNWIVKLFLLVAYKLQLTDRNPDQVQDEEVVI